MIVVAVIVIPSPRISGPWVMQKAECLQRVRSVNNSPFPSVGYHGMILNNFFFFFWNAEKRFLHGRRDES